MNFFCTTGKEPFPGPGLLAKGPGLTQGRTGLMAKKEVEKAKKLAKKEEDEVQAHVDNSGTNEALAKVQAHLAEQVDDIAGLGFRV